MKGRGGRAPQPQCERIRPSRGHQYVECMQVWLPSHPTSGTSRRNTTHRSTHPLS